MILDVIANSDEALDYRVRFVAYRTDVQPDGTFTAYVTEEIIERFPHLKRNFIVEPVTNQTLIRQNVGWD